MRRDRQALHLARSSGQLDVDELADLLDLVLAQLHWVARANRNSLGDVPERVRRLEDRTHPGLRLRRWWAARRRTGSGVGPAAPGLLHLMYGPTPLQPPVAEHP